MKSDLLAPLALPVFLLLAQCSPVAPPTARGSAHYWAAQAQNVPDANCNPAYGGIGDPPPEAIMNPTVESDLRREGMVVNKELSSAGTPYEVRCQISGNGDLAIDARLAGLNTSQFVHDPGSGTNISVKGTIHVDATGAGTGTGEVTFFTTPTKAVIPKENTTCELTASPTPLMACSNLSCLDGTEPGDYGGLAITFFCPSMLMGAAAGVASDCEGHGTIVVDRCTY